MCVSVCAFASLVLITQRHRSDEDSFSPAEDSDDANVSAGGKRKAPPARNARASSSSPVAAVSPQRRAPATPATAADVAALQRSANATSRGKSTVTTRITHSSPSTVAPLVNAAVSATATQFTAASPTKATSQQSTAAAAAPVAPTTPGRATASAATTTTAAAASARSPAKAGAADAQRAVPQAGDLAPRLLAELGGSVVGITAADVVRALMKVTGEAENVVYHALMVCSGDAVVAYAYLLNIGTWYFHFGV